MSNELSPKTFNRANIALTWITYAINNQFKVVYGDDELRIVTLNYLKYLVTLFEKPDNEKIEETT